MSQLDDHFADFGDSTRGISDAPILRETWRASVVRHPFSRGGEAMSPSFGPYEVIEQVAVGATGTVYRTRHVDLDRIAAVKELSTPIRLVPGLLERMRHEAAILAGLEDPHIVAVYDYVEEEDRAWIAEEWVNGASLTAILAQHGKLAPEQAVGVIRGALMGLAYAHDRHLVHRDIAPGNIIADMEGTSKLVDFGLAAPVGDTGRQGTPAFMSPEAARGEPILKASDVYSAAAVLYTLLNGRPPFYAPDVATTIRHHTDSPPPSLKGHGTDLADLLRRSMDKNPSARPQDAGSFLNDLESAARRRFGTSWLERASIAGIVAVTAAAAGTTIGGASTVPDAQAVVDAATLTTATTSRRFLGLTRAGAVSIGVAVAALIAGTAVAVPVLTSDDDDAAAGSAGQPGGTEGDPPTATEPPKPTFEELAPSGTYRFTQTTISSNVPGEKVGSTVTRVWTFNATCRQSACHGTISSTSGATFRYGWDGDELLVTAPQGGVSYREGPCADHHGNGEPVPGSHFKETTVVAFGPLTATSPSAEGPPERFSGIQTKRITYSELSPGCVNDVGVLHGRYRLSMVLQE